MGGNTVAIHSVLKKKTTKLNSQPAQYEKNKIDKNNSEKNNKKKWKLQEDNFGTKSKKNGKKTRGKS